MVTSRPPDDEQTAGTLDRILHVVTTLFAEYGFHGTSTRAIASTLAYHAGSVETLIHYCARLASRAVSR